MRSPFLLFLLPFFFVLHGFVENHPYISIMTCLPLVALYSGITFVVFLLSFLFFKTSARAALMTYFIMSFYLFFGALHDFLEKNHIVLHKYNLILPLFVIVGILLAVHLKRKNNFLRACLFLNTLVVIYIIVDGLILAWKVLVPDNSVSTTITAPEVQYSRCDDCPKPDIYLLLFDEYENSRMLKEIYGYDNSALDSFLIKEGFHIQTNSRSNYPITPFSMTSMFNMSYLQINTPDDIHPDDYEKVMDPDRKAEALRYLMEQGYSIVNNSAFDMMAHPSPDDEPYIPVKRKLIINRTLSYYISKDLGGWLSQHFVNVATFIKGRVSLTLRLNRKFLSRTLEESSKVSKKPRFVYMHVFMPHFPYLFDSLQRPRKFDEIHTEKDELERIHEYLNYLPYTNARVKEVISTIKKNTRGKAVIIFMSDHGTRLSLSGHGRNPYCFNNQNAIYLPGKDYHLFYDSITNVNEFRVVFNQLFRQHISLLKDSTIFLSDGRP